MSALPPKAGIGTGPRITFDDRDPAGLVVEHGIKLQALAFVA